MERIDSKYMNAYLESLRQTAVRYYKNHPEKETPEFARSEK